MNNAAKPRIMLVDDESGVVFALKLMLEALGCDVIPFSSGHDAIQEFSNNQDYSFILCDLRMPAMDGLEVLAAMKKINPKIPFILISGHATSEDIDQAKALGINGFLGKPFSPQDLQKLVRI